METVVIYFELEVIKKHKISAGKLCKYVFQKSQNFVRASLFLTILCDLTSYDSEDDS